MAEMMGGANGVTAKEAAMPERKETAGKSTAAEDHSEAEEGVFVYASEWDSPRSLCLQKAADCCSLYTLRFRESRLNVQS